MPASVAPPRARLLLRLGWTLALGALVAGCGDPGTTPTITPGTATHPRTVIIVTKDYTYVPAIVDLVPGESVVLQVLNGGVVIHEVVIGGMDVQDAWEAVEAATAGAPPGPTPQVSVAPDVAGLRIVVRSGERVDVPWTVPADAATRDAAAGGWLPHPGPLAGGHGGAGPVRRAGWPATSHGCRIRHSLTGIGGRPGGTLRLPWWVATGSAS